MSMWCSTGSGARSVGEPPRCFPTGAGSPPTAWPAGEVTTLDAEEVATRELTVTDMGQLMVSPATHRRRIQEIFALAAAGEVRPVIGRVDPLRDAARAHAAFEDRRITGKALLLTR